MKLLKWIKIAYRIFGITALVVVSLGSVALFSWLARLMFMTPAEANVELGLVMLGFAGGLGVLAFETLRPSSLRRLR